MDDLTDSVWSWNTHFETDTERLVDEPNHFETNQQQCLVAQNDPIKYDLPLTLNEIYTGCEKKQQIIRKIIDSDGNVKEETKTLTINIKPGTKTGTSFVFARVGHQRAGMMPSDVIFVTCDQPDEKFIREEQNVIYVARITSREAENGVELDIPSIDQAPMRKLIVNGKITKNTEKIIYGRGLPYLDDIKIRGNIIVRFEIIDNGKQKALLEEPSNHQIESVKLSHTVKAIKQILYVSLQEILNGCVRKEKVSFKAVDESGNETIVCKIFEIQIKPGVEAGKLFSFPQHDIPNVDKIVFEVQDEPNLTLKRVDSVNVQFVAPALEGLVISVPTVENKDLPLKITLQMLAKKEHRFFGKGLPYFDEYKMRGDLIVKFDLKNNNESPVSIDKSNKTLLPKEEKNNFASIFYKSVNLKVPLETLVHGGQVVQPNGNKEPFNITIRPATLPGQYLIVHCKGDPKRYVFVVCEEAHSHFQLKMPDVIYTAKIPLSGALGGVKQLVPTLEGEQICLDFSNQIITPTTVETIADRGFPLESGSLERRGNLVVHFEIIFPTKLTKEIKAELKRIFQESDCYSIPTEQVNKLLTIESVENNIAQQSDAESFQMDFKKPTHQFPLVLTFEEIVHGCQKTIVLTKVVEQSCKQNKFEEFCVKLNVPKLSTSGSKIKTTITSPINVKYQSEITFVVKEALHRHFRKINVDNGDIECLAQISLQDALCGFIMQLKGLDDKPISIAIGALNDPVPGYTFTRKFADCGLPNLNKWQRGCLVVHFEVVFPEKLTDSQRKSLAKCLQN